MFFLMASLQEDSESECSILGSAYHLVAGNQEGDTLKLYSIGLSSFIGCFLPESVNVTSDTGIILSDAKFL